MVAAYPPLSDDDMNLAVKLKACEFTAMDFHADNNRYLGDTKDIEVWTISGFVDPLDVEAEVGVEGWKFLFQTLSEDDTRWLPISDNHLLIQPIGMQASHRHAVRGMHSKYIRWVITVREVQSELIRKCALQSKAHRNTAEGSSLHDWSSNEELSARWVLSSKPTTHSKRTSKHPNALLSICYPQGNLYSIGRLLHDYDVLYCCSCNKLVFSTVHSRCSVMNPVVFGTRKQLTIGEVYTKEQLVEEAFNGDQRLEQSFRGDEQLGCTSIYLTRDYPGNDWSRWREGIIIVGGAGGRKKTSKRTKNSFGDTVYSYKQVEPQMSALNSMLMANVHSKLPLDVIVEHEKNVFMYLGSWFVDSVKLESGTMGSNGHSVFRHYLMSKPLFWCKMKESNFTFDFELNPSLASFILKCTSQSLIDDELNDHGIEVASQLAASLDPLVFVSTIALNGNALLKIFCLAEEYPIIEKRVIATMNNLK